MRRIRAFAEEVTREVLEVVEPLDADAASWVQEQLQPTFRAMTRGIAECIENSLSTRGPQAAIRADAAAFADLLVLDLKISLDKAGLRSAAATRARRNDPARMDALVPLPGRRAYDADLADAVAAASAADEPLSLIAFDIDEFKSVNDDHGGHATGDEALIAVARIADACVRGKGTAYRLSGDEFVVILPNYTAEEALAVAERIRRTVNERRLTSRDLTLGVSVGVAELPTHAADVAALKKAADAAAYAAKRLGRNLVRVADEPIPPAPAVETF
jgi:diguanylate cyclase